MMSLRERLYVQMRFNPHDLWIGVYWKLDFDFSGSQEMVVIYVCVIPMLPLRIGIVTRDHRWGDE